jgi:hypothetical protein
VQFISLFFFTGLSFFLSASLFFFFFALLFPLSWLVPRSIRKLGCVGVGREALWRLWCFVDLFPLSFRSGGGRRIFLIFSGKKNQKPKRTDDDDVVLALAMLLFAVIAERERGEERNREV